MFANLSINRDTGNLNIDPIYDCLVKKEPIVNKGIKIFTKSPGEKITYCTKNSCLPNKMIISQQNSELSFNFHNFSSVAL